MNIFPADLESAMIAQPGVKACAVVPCDFPSGPEPVCVVLFDGDEALLQQAVAGANLGLTDYQQIRRVLRWPDLTFPYTSTGKLLRRTVRDWACSIFAGGPPQPGDALQQMIAAITGESPAASEDLHLDSLGRVQLASMIEQKTGVTIDDSEMASIATVEQLRGAIAGADSSASSRPPSSPDHQYPRWSWSAPIQLLRSVFVEAVMRPLVALFLAPRVVLPAQPLPNGPFLIVANHVTMLDGALVLYALPGTLRRRMAIAMSGEMLRDFRSAKGLAALPLRTTYWLLTALFNVFPLPRLQGFRRSFAHAGEAIDRNYSILIFPEGTRSRSGRLGPFRPGIGLLATQAGIPVLPVALVGLEQIRGKSVRWFRSGVLEVRVGSPIDWAERKSAAQWTEELETAIRILGA